MNDPIKSKFIDPFSLFHKLSTSFQDIIDLSFNETIIRHIDR